MAQSNRSHLWNHLSAGDAWGKLRLESRIENEAARVPRILQSNVRPVDELDLHWQTTSKKTKHSPKNLARKKTTYEEYEETRFGDPGNTICRTNAQRLIGLAAETDANKFSRTAQVG